MTNRRTIKFRAWDELMQKYVSRCEMTDITLNFYVDRQCCSLSEMVFQQYTGLVDKNGVEIYEGDIVQGKFFDTDYMGDVLVTCPVNWVDESACFNIGNRYWTRSSIKVVGNIFENPELLES